MARGVPEADHGLHGWAPAEPTCPPVAPRHDTESVLDEARVLVRTSPWPNLRRRFLNRQVDFQELR